MKQNKFKITPQVYKELESITQKLPKFQRTDTAGNLMFRAISKSVNGHDIDPKDRAGIKDFDPKKRYIQKGKEALLVNHSVALRECYQKDGMLAVEAYCNYFNKLNEELSKK